MKDLNELIAYVDKTEDVQLRMMVEIVKEYDNEIPGIPKGIKEKHLPNDEKEKAEMIFSTVHRCKGMEYDSVQLVSDFLTEEKLEKIIAEQKEDAIHKDKLNEEINLLYVAVTRTKNNIHIPETLMPKDFNKSPQVHVVKIATMEDEKAIKEAYPYHKSNSSLTEEDKVKEKAYSLEKLRETQRSLYAQYR